MVPIGFEYANSISRVMKMLRFMMKPLQLLQLTCFDIIIQIKVAIVSKIYLAVSL